MKLKKLILFGLLLSSGLINAQTDFRSGYIIKKSGDTLYGKVDYRGDFLMSRICKFKSTDNVIKEYSPKDIIEYRFIDSKYFVSRVVDGESVFLEYLINGKVNIYYMRDNNGNHYFIEKEGENLVEIPYEEGYKFVGKKEVHYKSTNHIGFLKYYMKDAPEIQSKINNFKEPGHLNLIKIAKDYHNIVCKEEGCIIYEKKPPLFKVNLEIVSGVVNFRNAGGVINFENSRNIFKYEEFENLNDKFFYQSGVLAHLWMPRANEKVYFKTGLLYSQVKDNKGKNHSYFNVPLHIEYMAPSTYKIRPSVSIGLLSPSYSVGLVVKANKRINFGVQGWANFIFKDVFWVPYQLFNYTILGNLYIEL